MNYYKLFLKKSPANGDKFNKNLMKFLINNVKEMVKSQVFIKIILVNEKNINAIKSAGVKSTPALLFNSVDGESREIVIGVNNIIQSLIDVCETKGSGGGNSGGNNSAKKNVMNKSEIMGECDDVKDMLFDIINSNDDDDDEGMESADMQRKIRERLDSTNTRAESSTVNNSQMFSRMKEDNAVTVESIQMDMAVNTGNPAEDDAMSKYWANLEETVV
jgi:hypothetical protein